MDRPASLNPLDQLIAALDNGLRTVLAPAVSARPHPDEDLNTPGADSVLTEAERKLSAGLMRVNHSGEICAQALYQGQAMTARNPAARAALQAAATEETDHLAWTARRVAALGERTSVLNPLWYAGSFAMGAAAGLLGDKWNLGFLAETERQVEGHLEGHLDYLPEADTPSRVIVEQMKQDEARHAQAAVMHGAAELPEPVKQAMRLVSRVMTRTAFWI